MGKRIAMVGSGAVGGYVGGYLAHHGADVTFIDTWPEHVETMNRDGLKLRGVTEAENIDVKVRAVHVCEVQNLQKEGPFDIAFVSVKSYETQFATALIKGYLAEHGFVVSLQNAINEERIAEVVGWHRTTGCIASTISCALEAPGLVRRHVPLRGDSYTVFRAGEVHGRVTQRIQEVADMLSVIDSAKVTSNLWGERWSKLVINSSHNGLSAATGLGGNGMTRDDNIRKISIRMAAETIQVAQALGFTIEDRKGISADQWVAAGTGDAAQMKTIEDMNLAETKNRKDGAMPSMGQDMVKARKTEIDAINGFVVEKGREMGIATPLNEKIVSLVRKCERGEMEPDPSNVQGW
ncbi:MAG: 2-dehydropantoate 2-reductase [Alphaproteobacteria bacterium]|nr:2-dehydropantoate 2-reductase [Alphaproteobacteria bacterium]